MTQLAGPRTQYCRDARGFTLLEVLISVLVLSVGLLGAAYLQVNALRDARHAYEGVVANLAAKDLRERVWADLVSVPDDTSMICPNSIRVNEILQDFEEAWEGVLPLIFEIYPQGYSQSLSLEQDCEYRIAISWLRSGLFRSDGDLEIGECANLAGESFPCSVFNYTLRIPEFVKAEN